MCWFWGEHGQGDAYGRENELLPSQYESIIQSLRPSKPWLLVTGGETMLRPHSVLAIARTAVSSGMPVSLITNGTLQAREPMDQLVDLPIASIAFSIDGPELTHDSIRGPGAFARTRSTIKAVVERRGSARLPILSLNFTLTPWNHVVAPQMVKVAEELGVDRLTLQHLWFTSPEQAQEESDLLKTTLGITMKSINGHVIRHDFPDIGALRNSIVEVRSAARGSQIGVGFYPDFSDEVVARYYTEPRYSVKNRCLSPWSSLVVKPNGDAMFCPDLWITEYTLGNVRETALGQIWNSERANRFRSLLWSQRMFPACNRCCSLYGD